jgi:hypothetical protein
MVRKHEALISGLHHFVCELTRRYCLRLAQTPQRSGEHHYSDLHIMHHLEGENTFEPPTIARSHRIRQHQSAHNTSVCRSIVLQHSTTIQQPSAITSFPRRFRYRKSSLHTHSQITTPCYPQASTCSIFVAMIGPRNYPSHFIHVPLLTVPSGPKCDSSHDVRQCGVGNS